MNAAPPRCRFCRAELRHTFVDLGDQPLANSYPTAADVAAGRERRFPLHARVCEACFLVQVDDPVGARDIFGVDYAYLSSMSAGWVEHARRYAAAMIARFGLGPDSTVVEVASNDGYLLQHFRTAGVPVLGIEPAPNVAEIARKKGIDTRVMFFGEGTARDLAAAGVAADLAAANNVLAHVPDIRDFSAGFAAILKPRGVATFEFPHLLNLIAEVQFDTIYHEHFSYLSLLAVERVFRAAGLRVFDVEKLPTHGGSLRLFACRTEAAHAETPAVAALRREEEAAGLGRIATYLGFDARVEHARRSFRDFVAAARGEGKRIAAYGAAAKGNTFLNACGIGAADIVCVFDKAPTKQGRLLPGSHVPILAPEEISRVRPDYVVILPWNLAGEIRAQLAGIAAWGGRFVTAIPETRVLAP